jgi:lipoate-protein ligase A
LAQPLHVFHDPPLDGPTNMARDQHLLHAADLRSAALRLYAWDPPTISLGYFQRCADLDQLPDDVRELAVVRRQTGGGAILHDREITYCLVVDDSLDIARQAPAALYNLVHGAWRDALGEDVPGVEVAPQTLPFPSPRTGPFFCFQKPGQTDLILGPDKILGSAQRRTPGRVLQHGSLLLARRFDAHPGGHLGGPSPETLARWTAAFVAVLATRLELEPQPATWSPDRLADVATRRETFSSAEWTRRR